MFKKIVVRVFWELSKNIIVLGNLIFLVDFDGKLEIEIVMSEFLDYYGCMFVDVWLEIVCILCCYVI